VIVAACGNDSTDKPMYPAAYDEVVAVGAVESIDSLRATKTQYSNYGSYVDISAIDPMLELSRKMEDALVQLTPIYNDLVIKYKNFLEEINSEKDSTSANFKQLFEKFIKEINSPDLSSQRRENALAIVGLLDIIERSSNLRNF